MATNATTALANTRDDELETLINDHDLVAGVDDLRELIEWEPAPFTRATTPLPGTTPSTSLTFFQGEALGEDLVIAVTERTGTIDPYVIWLGTLEQAEEVFEKSA